jgi:C4-dicarboxylate-specific signal transduction histidine kinase
VSAPAPSRAAAAALRWRLLLLIFLALAPMLAVTAAFGLRERANALDQARVHLQRLATLAAASEAQTLDGAQQILRDLSSVPAVVAGQGGCREVLVDILEKNRDYVNFGLIGVNGDVLCSAVPFNTAVNLGDRLHFKRAVAERRFIAGNYVFGRVVQKHTVNLTYPVVKNNAVVGVLFAALDLTQLDKFVSTVQLPPDSVLWTLDEDQIVIAHRPDPAAWLGKTLVEGAQRAQRIDGAPAMYTDPDGIKRLYASSKVGPLSLSNYSLLIGVPEEGILAGADRDGAWLVAGVLVSLLLAGVVGWWGGRAVAVGARRR